MNQSTTPLMRISDVSKRFDAVGDGEGPLVLDKVELDVQQGEALAVVGPSGSGKSTLLHLMGALDRPTSGRVLLEGKDLAQLNDNALADLRNQRIGFVFQNHHLLPQCTALENVLTPTLARSSAAARQVVPRARALLEQVGLGERMGHRPGQLSGGECQRVAVVRALMNQPALVLADEPTGALDEETATALAELLVNLNREQGVTLVVVTHDPGLAGRFGRRLALRKGTLTQAKDGP